MAHNPFDPTEILRRTFGLYPGGFERAMQDIARTEELVRAASGARLAEEIAREQRQREEILGALGGAVRRDLQDAISRAGAVSLPPGLHPSPMLDQINAANASLVKLAEPMRLEQASVEWNRRWSDAFSREMKLLVSGPGEALAASIAQVSRLGEISGAAEMLLRRVEWEAFVSSPLLPEGAGAPLQAGFGDFVQAYANLAAHLETDVAALPPLVSALPPIEMYAGTRLLGSISGLYQAEDGESDELGEALALRDELEREAISVLEESLTAGEPALLHLWRGARQALESRNPDRARHVTVSLRELATSVLHRLAPDDKVTGWSTNPQHYHNGRPTRRARCLYIVRAVNDGVTEQFVEKDVDSALAFFEALQHGTHGIASGLSDDQLAAMILRAETLIRFLFGLDSLGH